MFESYAHLVRSWNPLKRLSHNCNANTTDLNRLTVNVELTVLCLLSTVLPATSQERTST